jgi:hypothetical protein
MIKIEKPDSFERLVSVYRSNEGHNPKYHNVNYKYTNDSVGEKNKYKMLNWRQLVRY